MFSHPKWTSELEEKLVKEQRILSRRTQGGSSWCKQWMKVAKIHERITCARTDYLQKTRPTSSRTTSEKDVDRVLDTL
ncbi:hypothetical protein GCM10007096_23540 [Pullulanibacillus pueri]|uniref:Probable transposase IS891/IS1136/IS1341 domain-containing protein n=1 Tax=Pullulanibacillus pueri TaxID=1437324 RepID=A0A8J2ZWM8_9BACL|nr:hypothetical protein GCM10007096_23540 [Pullulanibacillus pueri]